MEVFVVFSPALDVENIIGVYADADAAEGSRTAWMKSHPGLYAYTVKRTVEGGAK